MSYNIAVIGAGQLGRRHMQSIANSELNGSLYVVDPFESSLAAAKAALSECDSNASFARNAHWLTDASGLPSTVDAVVVATTADVRLEALQSLFKHSQPRNIILEKVLFQRAADFSSAQEMFDKADLKNIWVNCPRRAMAVYQDLATFFSDDPVMRMDVHGGDWGLGCNAIHFIDLLAYLSRQHHLQLHIEDLTPGFKPSKRDRFIEFTGTLNGRLGASTFSLTAQANSNKKVMISLHGQTKSAVLDEATGTLWKHEGLQHSLESFTLPYQSQITGPLIQTLLATGACPLTQYSDAVELHIPLLEALSLHIQSTGRTLDACPIT